jgi:hypothetical protein
VSESAWSFPPFIDDDTLLFFRASSDEALKVKKIIDVYANGTGQLINPAKCSIIISKYCSQSTQDDWSIPKLQTTTLRANIWDCLSHVYVNTSWSGAIV